MTKLQEEYLLALEEDTFDNLSLSEEELETFSLQVEGCWNE